MADTLEGLLHEWLISEANLGGPTSADARPPYGDLSRGALPNVRPANAMQGAFPGVSHGATGGSHYATGGFGDGGGYQADSTPSVPIAEVKPQWPSPLNSYPQPEWRKGEALGAGRPGKYW